MADIFKGNSYEDYEKHFTDLSENDPQYSWYKGKPDTIKAMANVSWKNREKEMKKEAKAFEKQKTQNKKNFDTWSESLDMSNFYFDDDSGNIIDTKTGSPITQEQVNTLTSNNRIARKNLNDVYNYANSGVYRIGSQPNILASVGKAAAEGISALFGKDSKANAGDLANYLNGLVEKGQATLPPGKKEYTRKDAEELLRGGIAQYNGYFVTDKTYHDLQDKAKAAQKNNVSGKDVFSLGQKDADAYFAGNQTAAQKVEELSKNGYSENEIKNYFTGLYSGKGGLTENAKNALDAYYSKDSNKATAQTENKGTKKMSEPVETKVDDKATLTNGKTDLGKGIDSIYNDLANETQKSEIEKTIQRYNKGFKSNVGDSWKDEIKDAFGTKLELLKGRPITTIADYLGTALMNASGVIKGGDTSRKSMLQNVDQETLKGALERYNAKKNKMVEDDIALLGKEYENDQNLKWQLKQLYANKELMRKIQDLDINNRKALLQAYKTVADSGLFGDNAEEIITNVLKIGATQGAMEGGLPQAISQLAGAAGTAIGGAASGLGNAVGSLFNFVK